ncbi:MAG: redoxin domain-containing protein [Ktedonobacterales bacterium]
MESLSGHLNGQIVPLSSGLPAPDFTLPQTGHASIALRAVSGHPVVLVFYPFDWELVSREQLTLYQDFADEFDRLGARLLGISVDHVYSHEAFARTTQISFPLLADFQPRGATARRYGVYRQADGVCARALFVLDSQHVVRFSKAYPDALNPGVGELLTTLEAIAQDDKRVEGS